jgi:hypothetical protein
MKLLIHCDEVFDILTRGPFPSGSESDPAVEHHLRCCHDCRQLAEALRPAVALFHECLSDEEVRSLPEYHGDVVPLAQPHARRLPRDIAEVRMPPEIVARDRHPLSERRSLLAQGFIAIMLSAAVVLLVISFGSSLRGLRNVPPSGSFRWNEDVIGARPSAASQDAARQLLALHLPTACWLGKDFPTTKIASIEQQIALALDRHEIACCTRCHAENKSHTPAIQQIATLQKSCLVCHKG